MKLPMRRRMGQTSMVRIAGLITVLLVGFALLTGPRSARAHGYILRSIPQDRSALSRAPTRIQIWFSENLESRFSTLTLADQNGQSIPLAEVGVSPTNPALLSARISRTLPDGPYVVTIRAAFASDGHVGVETLIFWVGQQTGAAIPGGSGGTTSQNAVPLEVLWRALTLASLDVLFGTLLLYQAALLPGWGNARYRAGRLAPRVMSRLNRLIWVSIVVAALGCVLALLQQTMSLFATDLDAVLGNRLWSVVLQGTQFGDVLQIRLLLIVALGAVQAGAWYLSSRLPGFVASLWAVNVVIAGLILGTISASSHAAGSTLWPLPSVAVDWLHVLANAAWIGGLVGLVVVLPPALRPLSVSERRAAMRAVLRHFSAIGGVAVALLVVTGIYNALVFVREPAEVTTTNYGQTLLFKILLIVPLLLIALYHHATIADDWLARWTRRLRLPDRVINLSASLRLEAVIGVGVILVVGVLTATPPPVPPDARGKVVAPSQAQTVADLQIKLSIDPDAPGGNSYEVDVARNGQPLAGAQIRLRFVYPSLDKRSDLLALDDLGDGSYFGAGAELERSGDWQVLVDVLDPSSPASRRLDVRAAFQWIVPQSAPDVTTRQPTILNWLSAASILVVLGVWLWPPTVHRVQHLNLQTESVAVGLMITVVAAVLLVMGGWFVTQAGQQTDALRNPTPAAVNPAVADAASLAAGKAVYEAQCVSCHGPSGGGTNPDMPNLQLRLPTRRDDDLNRLLDHTGTEIDLQLSAADRWNVINYLRSPVFAPPPPGK